MRLFCWLVVFLSVGLVARAQTSVTTSISAGGASITSTLSSNGDWTSSRTNGGVTGGEYRYNIGSYVAKVAASGSFEKVAGDWVLVSSAKSNVSDPPATFNGSVETKGWHILWTYYVRIKNSDNSGQSTIVSQSVDWIEVSDRSPQNINAVRTSTEPAMALIAERWDVTGNMTGATPSIEAATNCNVLVNSSGVMMVTPTAEGAYSFVVTVAGNEDYYEGMDVGAGNAAPFSKNWKFTINNKTERPIQWRVIQGANVLKSGVAAPMTTGTVSGTTNDKNTPIRLQYLSEWIWDNELGAWIKRKPPVWVDAEVQNVDDTDTNLEGGTNLDGSTTPNASNKENSTGMESVNEENKDGPVTAGQFAEGIGKIEAALNEQTKKQDEIVADKPTEQDIMDKIDDATDRIKDIIPAPDSAPSYSVPSGLAPDFKIRLPSIMGGKEFDFDPFRSDRLGPICDWFRAATQWLVIGLFAFWAGGELRAYVAGVAATRQATGNPVLAGTGAQITALANAIYITVAFVTFLLALFSFLSGDFAVTNLFNSVEDNPLQGMPVKALWMLEKVFPVGTMLGAFGLRITWRFWGTQAFGVAVSVIRFCVR